MCNEFETLGIVVTSTNRSQHAATPDQADWANAYFGKAFDAERPALQKELGGYPESITFTQSCVKATAEKFDPRQTYTSLEGYSTIQPLLTLAETTTEPIYVLCWGPLTEPAILVKHALTAGKSDVLKKLMFIAHWTNSVTHQGTPEHPEHVANCRDDAAACAFLKSAAKSGAISYYECGAIGQFGIVSGSPKEKSYYDQFRVSQLGTLFVEGKFVHNCVDHSDSATYWVLLGHWGVSLEDIDPRGLNSPETELANEKKFYEASPKIHDELLRRAQIAARH